MENLLTIIIKAVCDFVSYYHTNSTIVECSEKKWLFQILLHQGRKKEIGEVGGALFDESTGIEVCLSTLFIHETHHHRGTLSSEFSKDRAKISSYKFYLRYKERN